MKTIDLNSTPEDVLEFLKDWQNNDPRRALMCCITDITGVESATDISTKVGCYGLAILTTMMMLGNLTNHDSAMTKSIFAAMNVLQNKDVNKEFSEVLNSLIEMNNTRISTDDLPDGFKGIYGSEEKPSE